MICIRFSLLVIGAFCCQVDAFLPPPTNLNVASRHGLFEIAIGSDGCKESDESAINEKSNVATRTAFMQGVIQASLGACITSCVMSNPLPVFASGGSTAGGAYLLSGEQRSFAIRPFSNPDFTNTSSFALCHVSS